MFSFQNVLTTALQGMDASGIMPTLQGIGYALLAISLLWSMYEAFARGGDVRSFVISLLKYVVVALLVQHWSNAFRDINNGFNSVASYINNATGATDVAASWMNELKVYWSANGITSIGSVIAATPAAIINALFVLLAYIVWPLATLLFDFMYSFWGAVLYGLGPIVLGLVPSGILGRFSSKFATNLIIWNCWALLWALFGALIGAVNMTQVQNLLNSNGIFGYMQGLEGAILIGVASILYSICIVLIPFVAHYILGGEFGAVGGLMVMTGKAITTAGSALLGGIGGSAAVGGGSSPALAAAGSAGGGYGGGAFAGGGGGSYTGFALSSPGGGSGVGRISLPPPVTPPPSGKTRFFPARGQNDGPKLLPPPATT